MLLQTRIILFVLVTVTTVAVLLLGVADLREAAVERRVRELELTRLDDGWQHALGEAAGVVGRRLGALTAEDTLATSLIASDRTRLSALASAVEGDGITKLNLLNGGGELLYSTGDALDPRPLVGAVQSADLLSGRGAPRGVRAVEEGRVLVVAGVPVYADNRIVGAVVAGVPLAAGLDALHRIVGGKVFAVDRDGTPIHGGDDPLWPAVRRHASFGDRDVVHFERDGRHMAVASLPVADLGGGRIATVLVASDVSAATVKRNLWNLAYGGGILLIVVTALFLLFVYLRRSFETLEIAVSTLHGLAEGETGRYAELPEGSDEIGRIGQAVRVFGQTMRDVQRSAGQRERRLRRQQRFIRRQMEQLATTLEEDARHALLEELNQIEAAALDPQSAQSKGVNDELGLIALGFSRLATRVSMQQVQLLGLVRDLREALDDKRRLISLQQELEIARTMQLSILPQDFPDMPELDLCARMVPAKEVGGDFYDFFPISDRKLAITIADVSGKGIPAAFFMLITRTMLRAIAGTAPHPGPAETMRRLNNLLAAENEQMMFVTVFYGEIDLDTGELVYCSAGHNPPYQVTPAGEVKALPKTPGIALATFPDLPFGEKRLTLAPGDTLVTFTDGVSEAFDAKEVMFGEARLEKVLAEGRLGSSRAGLDRMMDAVAAFTVGAEQSDDITGLVVHWRGAPALAGGELAEASAG